MPEHREWEIGRHHIRFEPPDLLWVKHRGGVSLEEAIRMVDISRELGERRPFFMVSDMSEAGMLGLEAGRYLSENLRFEWFLGGFYLGTRLAQRAALKGIILAAYLTDLTDERNLKLLHFVSSKDEALAGINQLRAGLAARPPNT